MLVISRFQRRYPVNFSAAKVNCEINQQYPSRWLRWGESEYPSERPHIMFMKASKVGSSVLTAAQMLINSSQTSFAGIKYEKVNDKYTKFTGRDSRRLQTDN